MSVNSLPVSNINLTTGRHLETHTFLLMKSDRESARKAKKNATEVTTASKRHKKSKSSIKINGKVDSKRGTNITEAKYT